MTVDINTPDEHTVVVNGHTLRYDQAVQETLAVGDLALVLLNGCDFPEDDPEGGRNVFAYDATGNLLWRIQDAGFKALGEDGQDVPQGYTHIGIEDGMLRAVQPTGCICFVDLETGKIVKEHPTR